MRRPRGGSRGGAERSDKINDSVQSELTKSFSSAADTAQRYPQYAKRHHCRRRSRRSYRVDQWAYIAGIVAIVLGAILVFFFFPKKAEEERLLAEYQAHDDSRRAGSTASDARSPETTVNP